MEGVAAGAGRQPSSPESPGPMPESSPQEATPVFFTNMQMRSLAGKVALEHLHRVSVYMMVFGLLFVAVGIASILFPIFSALAVEQLIAWLLLLNGFISVVQFFLMCGTPGIISFLLLGLLHVGVGLWMLLHPLAGSAVLVLVLSGWFLANGVLKIMMACQISNMRSWPMVLVSGILSIILSLTIILLAPRYGLMILGIIFGVDVLGLGLSMVVISCMAQCGRKSHVLLQEPLIPGDVADSV